MSNAFFSFTPFDFGVGVAPQLEDYEKDEEVMTFKGKEHLFSMQELGFGSDMPHGFFSDIDDPRKSCLSKEEEIHQQSKPSYSVLDNLNFEFESVSSLHHKAPAHHENHEHFQRHEQSKPDYSILDNFSFDSAFPSTQSIHDHHDLAYAQIGGSEMAQTNQFPYHSSLAVVELLNSYGSSFKKLRAGGNETIETEADAAAAAAAAAAKSYAGHQKLSTEEIMRVAGARFLQFSNQGYGDFYMPLHPFGYALLGLSDEETKDVELAHILLAAAEKVEYQQFERASRLLLRCEWIASFKTNPVQRVVFYFAEGLRERIEKETGIITTTTTSISSPTSKGKEMSVSSHGLSTNLAFITCYQKVPFNSVMQFTGIQAIIESVALENKIHLIDLEIRSGVQWTGLMEALAERDREECPIELLAISAVGVEGKQKIAETGRRLESVAESLNIPFKFKAVIVSDMEEIKEQMFDVDDDEAVAVYAPLVLRTMIGRPSCLENVMRVMRNLSPNIMVVLEVEANHNSPSFVNRFIEALFYYSAFFDSLGDYIKQDNDRGLVEGLLREGIRNIVAAEGRDRVTRSVKMDVWRSFFARFRMMEIEFSNASLYQASLVVKKFGNSASCTLDRNGKCLTVGWKGTPLHSVSAWKFR